jgi:ATP-dependent RNA helicase DDX23/PRP28
MSSSSSPEDILGLLKGLTEAQRDEALAAAAVAKRAEERAEQRAEQRALERAMKVRQEERTRQQEQEQQMPVPTATTTTTTTINSKIVFVSKGMRQQQEQEQQTTTQESNSSNNKGGSHNHLASTSTSISSSSFQQKKNSHPPQPRNDNNNKPAFHSSSTRNNQNHAASHHRTTTRTSTSAAAAASWTDKERHVIRKTYLGTSNAKVQEQTALAAKPDPKRKKKKGSKKAIFRFEWDNTDDTLDDQDPLYSGSGGMRSSMNTSKKRRNLTNNNANNNNSNSSKSMYQKPLEEMTTRDWRIYRENYEIVVKGGRAPPPLRSFQEGNLHDSLLHAIEHVMHYKEPTPIQRQAIPIGLQRRDLIGIAETGSGKTCAFGVPLLEYILSLPPAILNRVAAQGPLALVLAPTRELALQIHGEFQKLMSRQSTLVAAPIVGGQPIQHQAQQLRDGLHIVVGTPGRINDCIDLTYMVLNQCCYIVLDEADRMIDMGFAPQMESILDAMGGLLKSENEQEAYQQEDEDKQTVFSNSGLPRHRLTAMFSATMPLEVERLAKRYLRHPAVISIGDQDSSKNKRIVQRVLFLSSPAQKESALRQLILNPRYMREKIIVFVNEKKHADGVGRMVERIGRACVVLHGGKSQDQREENLAKFRQGGGIVLVATDVAGRGLDIPNVAHIINFDLPTRSIDSYSHRIGRTGRAGKEGLATSLMTDADESIMAPLKAYLESTGQPVPEKLARHPAANANAQGNLIY